MDLETTLTLSAILMNPDREANVNLSVLGRESNASSTPPTTITVEMPFRRQ